MSLFLSTTEKDAVQRVVAAGVDWGYGNLISRLQVAWALALKSKHPDISWRCVCQAAGMNKDKVGQIQKSAEQDEKALMEKLLEYIGV